MGCGGSNTKTNTIKSLDSYEKDNNITKNASISQLDNNSPESSINTEEDDQVLLEPIIQHETNITIKNNITKRAVNIYIHGYNKKGAEQTDTYGKSESDTVLRSIAETTGYSTIENHNKEDKADIIAMTDYYGKIPPSYYTTKDIQEVNAIQKGIPRYALIVAKYARYILQETGADSVNLVSASMGTLVSRYLIEKDLEKLSSEKKIKKWLSFEGVIMGNIAASKRNLVRLLNTVVKQPIEVEQMNYDWINNNLSFTSPYYKDIQIGFESSTKDNLNNKLLTSILLLENKFEANDGVQAVRDTFFETTATHTFFHETHTSISDNKAVWGFAATFLTSKKQVSITLLEATVDDLHEDSTLLSKRAEIVFQSSVHSQKAEQKWNFTEAIDERMYDGSYLKLYKYSEEGENKILNQVLFDSFVLENETELLLSVTPYEIDREVKYGIFEILGNTHESLGQGSITIPMQSGVYNISGTDWSGKVKVEIK